ncbi:hypothetical protein UZ470_26005, partial [Escherichia coli]|nr:hypothetical protein [Escherichia coli]
RSRGWQGLAIFFVSGTVVIAPIFTGPFQNQKHRGAADAQKRAIYDAFRERVHHHHLINI